MRPDLTRMVRALPCEPGVYRFRDARDRVLYLGRATDLRGRAGSYFTNLGDRRHLAPMVAAVASIEALVCDSVHEASWLERNLLERDLLETALPRWNRTPGGQEVPVYAALDPRPASPGLRVVHGGPRPGLTLFGPYLGGRRVRDAVRGLLRAYPLDHAGTRLRGAEQDMAARLGISPADRAPLTQALTAVLNREPAAVERTRATLTRAREQAVGVLAFERAAQLTDELRALDWITATQRVTDPAAGDLSVRGWSNGVLVDLTIRAGRLSGWTQTPGSPAPAAPPPAHWRDFATRNAALAASLAGV